VSFSVSESLTSDRVSHCQCRVSVTPCYWTQSLLLSTSSFNRKNLILLSQCKSSATEWVSQLKSLTQSQSLTLTITVTPLAYVTSYYAPTWVMLKSIESFSDANDDSIVSWTTPMNYWVAKKIAERAQHSKCFARFKNYKSLLYLCTIGNPGRLTDKVSCRRTIVCVTNDVYLLLVKGK